MKPTRTAKAYALSALVLLLAGAAPAQSFYGMGSSNVAGVDDWLREFLRISSMTGTCGRLSVPGAPMSWIWQQRAVDYNPNPETYLQTNAVDVLYMVPSTVWAFRHQEVPACVGFSIAAIQGNPNTRVFIQERWYLEDSLGYSPRYCYFYDDYCDPYPTTEFMFRPHHVKTAYEMASQIDRKVYITPDAASIEGVKDLIEAGQLDRYHDRIDLHAGLQPDGSINWHLSPLGHYVHALALWAAAYHQDPRDLPGVILRYGGSDTMVALTQHDADLIQQVVYDSVKAAPFGGWGVNEPATYAEYLDSLWSRIRNLETFDNIDTTAGNGRTHDSAFTGESGIRWTYHRGTGSAESWLTIGEETLVLGTLSGSDAPYLSAVIPSGISQIAFQYRNRYKLPGPADTYKYRLAVLAGGDTVAVLNKILVGSNPYGYYNANIALPPGGELKLVSLGTDAVMIDNVQWKDYQGPVRAIPGPATGRRATQHVSYRDGMLSVPAGSCGHLAVATLHGRMVTQQRLTGEARIRLGAGAGLYVVTVRGNQGSQAFRVVGR